MRGSIEEILNELGWDNGFRIPVANGDNKRLEEEIDQKIKEKKALVQDLAVNEERIKSIQEYMSNVGIEHNHNQKLLTAYAAQHNAEDHMFKISEHDKSSVAQEMRNLDKEKMNIEERITLLRKEMEKLEETLTSSANTVAFDKNKLLQWEQLLIKEEEDEHLLQRYLKSDAKEFKTLELKRQKLTVEMDSLKSLVLQIMSEISEMEIILEKTSGFYVQCLEERGELIDRWSQSVVVLRQRDTGIHEILREIDTLKEIGKNQMTVLLESEQFLKNQISSNRQSEDSSRHLEHKLFLEKEERRKIVETNALYELEYQGRKKCLQDVSRRFQRLKSDRKSTQNAINSKRNKIRALEKEIEDIKGTVSEIDDQSVSAADRLKQLEAMLESEEKRKSHILKETKRFQDLILRISNRMAELEGERKILDLEKNGQLKRVEIFGVHQSRDEQRLTEKKEMDQRLNFEIEECEMKRGKIGPDDFSRAELASKLRTLEGLQRAFSDKTEVEKLLGSQLANLDNHVRRIQGSLKGGNEELCKLRGKKQGLAAMMDGGEKQLKGAQGRNEEKQVAENILELRVTQAEQIVKNIGDKLHNLEKYRLKMDSAMKERLAEIKVEKEALHLEKRIISSDCVELRSAMCERQSRMQHLQSRYDTIISAMGSNEINGAPLTTTYLKIANAQEKAELQEQGDKLDMTIRRTEQEIRSMENTLRIVNICNDKYKSSLDVSGDDEISGELLRKQLDEDMFNAVEAMKYKQIELDDAEVELQGMLVDFERRTEQLKDLKEEKELKLRAVAHLEKQIGEQKERISRAEKSLRKLYKDVQKVCENADDDGVLLQEKDIATRELQEQNFLALQRITEFTIRHVEAEIYVKKLLASKNISLPCAQHLKPSPSPSLCESSPSSMSSSGRSRLTSTRQSASRIHTIPAELVFEVVGGSKSSKRLSSSNHQSSGNR